MCGRRGPLVRAAGVELDRISYPRSWIAKDSRMPGIPGVAAGVYTELLLRGEDHEGFLAKTEGLQLPGLLLHSETVIASRIEVKIF